MTINKKICCIAGVLAIIASSAAYAGVTFLPATEGGVGNGGYTNLTPAQKCQNEGYTYTSCPEQQIPTGECPYNRSYYKGCCPEGYQYTRQECTNAGLRYSRNSCGGYYKCL